ncbi:MAG: alpha/beta hydrolase, partial [Candidatus Krumholzibacteria bacterium]|nr:alpha/beta hydrolase [Candidatus Krumholzibacteria bacterium]
GRSLGGAVAIELATHVHPRALIVESTFTSAAELGARVYPWLPVRQLARIRYDSLSRVGYIRCPKLFVHSLHDDVVPYSFGLKLFQRAREPKQMLKIRGSHNDGFLTSGRKYVDGLESFLDGLEKE